MSNHHEFSTGGKKDLKGKLRIDLVPPEAEEAIAEILGFGSTKYQDRNWEKGIPMMSLYGAVRRHLLKWLSKDYDDLDEESKLNHLKHALCDLAMMVTFEMRGRTDLDDRPQTTKPKYNLHSCCYDSSDGIYTDSIKYNSFLGLERTDDRNTQ